MERHTEDPKLFTKRELDLYTAHVLKHLEARILSHDASDETGDEAKATHLRMVRAWQRNEELPTVQWAEMIADTYNTPEPIPTIVGEDPPEFGVSAEKIGAYLEEKIFALIDGELSDEEVTDLRALLDTDPRYRAKYEDYRRFTEMAKESLSLPTTKSLLQCASLEPIALDPDLARPPSNNHPK